MMTRQMAVNEIDDQLEHVGIQAANRAIMLYQG